MVNHQEFRDSLAREMKARIRQRNQDLQKNAQELEEFEKTDWQENIKGVLRDVAAKKKEKIIEVFKTDIAEMQSRPGYAEAKASRIATMKAKKELDLAKKTYEEKKKEYTKTYNEYTGIEINPEIPSELAEYRELWKKNIRKIKDETKDKIIRASEEIDVNVEDDEDGSRIITLKVGDNTYHILDSNLKNHSNAGYTEHENSQSITMLDKDYALRGGMMPVNDKWTWNNIKLAKYVEKKESEGWHLPDYSDIDKMLNSLGKFANINSRWDQMAMLMYLTGMDGRYYTGHMKDIYVVDMGPECRGTVYDHKGAGLFMLKN